MFEKTIQMTFTTEIAVDTQTLYDFHLDTNNLVKITPPWIKVKIVTLKLPIQQGDEIELDISRFGMTQRWKMKIAELKAPELVCDKAVDSPFATFVHHHRFIPLDESNSILCDELTFSLPFYPLSAIALPFVKKDMKKMFDYRHTQTKTILEKNDV